MLVSGALSTQIPVLARQRWRLADSLWARRSHPEMLARNAVPLGSIQYQRLRFGSHPRQYVHWFYPDPAVEARHTLLLYVHGGGWRSGSPDYYFFLGRHFAAHGYPVVLAGYRLLPDATLRPMLDDLAHGLRRVLGQARQHGWQGEVTVIGQSAGAHLGALLAFAVPALTCQREGVPSITGLLTLGGVLDFSQHSSDDLAGTMRALVGAGSDPIFADPLRYVVAPSPRVLCVHGRKDWLVRPQHSKAFVERVNAVHPGQAALLLEPHHHHADLLDVLYRPSRAATNVRIWLEAG